MYFFECRNHSIQYNWLDTCAAVFYLPRESSSCDSIQLIRMPGPKTQTNFNSQGRNSESQKSRGRSAGGGKSRGPSSQLADGAQRVSGCRREYTNWRDEQRAWQQTAVLFNQSYHMTDMYVAGPDALKLLSDTGINSFKGFEPDKAKQFVPCNYDGYVIGDVVLFYLEKDLFNLIGRPSVHNWVQYHAETGEYNVNCERDERTAARTGPVVRKRYRFQVQGPNAMKTMRRSRARRPPELKFFNMTTDRPSPGNESPRAAPWHGRPAGLRAVRTLGRWRSGPHGHLSRPARNSACAWSAPAPIRPTRSSLAGFLRPMPAVYSGEKMKAYRQWLPANSYEGKASLGGSFYSNNIEDYYLTPWDLGYGAFVKFDHDFIGREALEKMAKQARTARRSRWRWTATKSLTRSIPCSTRAGPREVFRLPLGRVLHAALR